MWLNASQPSPLVHHDQIGISCDRISCQNKGGFLICIRSQMQPSNTHRFASNGIECVYTTICLPDAGMFQIPLLYRSPSESMATLRAVLSRLLAYVSVSNMPCVILGELNEDLLHQHHSSLQTLMSNHGFTQLVQCPTTPQGTLIHCR